MLTGLKRKGKRTHALEFLSLVLSFDVGTFDVVETEYLENVLSSVYQSISNVSSPKLSLSKKLLNNELALCYVCTMLMRSIY